MASSSSSIAQPQYLSFHFLNKKLPALALALQAHLSAEGAAAEDAGTLPAFEPSLRITCAAAVTPSLLASPSSSAVVAAAAAGVASSSSPAAALPRTIVGGGGTVDRDETTAAGTSGNANGDGSDPKKKKKTSIFGRLLKKTPSGGGGGGGSSEAASGARGAGATKPTLLVSGGRAAAEPALAAGATWCPMLDQVAEECDVVLCCLPGDGPLEAAARAVAVAAGNGASSDKRQQSKRRCFVALGPASREALVATGKVLSHQGLLDFAAVHLTGDADAVRRGALLAHVAGPKSEAKKSREEAERKNSAAAYTDAASSSPPPPPSLYAAETAELLLEPLCRDVLFLSQSPAVAGDVAGVSAVLAAGMLEAVAEAAAAADALKVPRARAHVARLASELCHSAGAAAVRLGPAAAARRMADATPTAFPAAPADACVSALAAAARHGAAAAAKLRVPTPAASAAVVHWGQVEESGGGHLDVAALASALRDAAGLD